MINHIDNMSTKPCKNCLRLIAKRRVTREMKLLKGPLKHDKFVISVHFPKVVNPLSRHLNFPDSDCDLPFLYVKCYHVTLETGLLNFLDVILLCTTITPILIKLYLRRIFQFLRYNLFPLGGNQVISLTFI